MYWFIANSICIPKKLVNKFVKWIKNIYLPYKTDKNAVSP